jgi:hypothetical protein
MSFPPRASSLSRKCSSETLDVCAVPWNLDRTLSFHIDTVYKDTKIEADGIACIVLDFLLFLSKIEFREEKLLGLRSKTDSLIAHVVFWHAAICMWF